MQKEKAGSEREKKMKESVWKREGKQNGLGFCHKDEMEAVRSSDTRNCFLSHLTFSCDVLLTYN